MIHPPPPDLLRLEPVPTLRRRLAEELGGAFDPARPIRISRAPGRLDVMGGIADYTGSLVCEATLGCAAAVATQPRDDREIQIFSFNLFDEQVPFTFRMSLDDLLRTDVETLRREFSEPGRKWAGYLAGCIYVLHQAGVIDLRDAEHRGLNIALLSTVPMGAGVSSSAAIEVAMMMNLVDAWGVRHEDMKREAASGTSSRSTLDPMRLAELCQVVENYIVGAPCGIMDQVTSCSGHAGSLLRLLCQPHELKAPLFLPRGIRAVGINSNVTHNVGGGMYGRTRCAAFMAHRMILEKMREMGRAGGKELVRDPMNGYLANLDINDFKFYFRSYLPEWMKGSDFLARYGGTIDTATQVEPELNYPVQHAADHHVLEANRVRNFVNFLEEAAAAPPGTREQGKPLDLAGHLMYASHMSYTNDAMLGAAECDLLVDLVRKYEPAGLYGAKITGAGSGGTVAVLCNQSDRADRALADIMAEYEKKTGVQAHLMTGTSPGAWHVGTAVVEPQS